MNNFHYKNSQPLKSPQNSYDHKLIEQLKQIDRSMEEDRRRLKVEQQKQRMLQQQFYEDSGKLSNNKPQLALSQVEALANQVMDSISIPLNRSPYQDRPNTYERPINYENPSQKINYLPDRKEQQNPRSYNQVNHQLYDRLPLQNQNLKQYAQKNFNLPQRELHNAYMPVVDQFRGDPHQQRKNNFMENIDRMQKNGRINSASKRELQKLKLQEKNANQYQYPFGILSRENNKKVQNFARFKQQNKSPIPQNDKMGKNREQSYEKNRTIQENPFLKDEQYLKQKRDQQQRQYRKLLQQQVQIQKKKKQQMKRQIKEQQYQFNTYVPQTQNKRINSPQILENQVGINKPRTKKIDPNGEHPQYQQNSNNIISESDLHYMKLKVDQIKLKRRKGRMDNEEYETTLKKIEEYYKCKIDRQFEQDKQQAYFIERPAISNVQQKDRFQINEDLADAAIKNITSKPKDIESVPNPQQNFHSRTNKMNSQEPYFDNHSSRNYNIHNASSNSNAQQHNNPSFNTYQTMIQTTSELMMNMMKQYLEAQKDMTMNQHKLMHQTLSRMYPALLMQQMQNNSANSYSYGVNTMTSQYPQPINVFQTQQVPHLYPDPYPRVPSTDAKLYKQYKQRTYQAQNIYNQNMDTSDYVEKSLEAIASKIPLTKNQLKISEKQQQSQLENFFKKAYKVKKFKTFQFVQNVSQSKKQISCLSNSLSWKEGKSILNQSFERDLKLFKKLQVSREIQFMREKINGNSGTNYDRKSQKNALRVNSYQEDLQKLNREGQKIRNVLKINDFDNKTDSSKNVNNSYLQNSPPQPRKNTKRDQFTPNDPSNRSPNNKKNSNSCHQYEQYVKKQQKSSISNNPFLKKHVSSNDQQYKPPIIDHKDSLNHPIDSPKKISTEILQQDEYETEPRKRYEQADPRENVSIKLPETSRQKASKSNQVMNIIVANNQMLQKYQMSSGSKYQSVEIPSQTSPANQSHKESFSNFDISPVRRQQNEAYEESLETVRSEQQSARLTSNMLKKEKKYEQIEASQQQNYEIYEQPENNESQFHNELKTVQSCQQSSGILIMNRPRPPMLKKHRSTSRKKETSLTRSKVTNKTLNQNSQRHEAFNSQLTQEKDKYSPSQANQSEYEQSHSQNPHGSSLLRPPQIQNQMQNSLELSNPKFDSNVYNSCYQETLNEKDCDKIIPSKGVFERQQVQNSGDMSNLKGYQANKKQQKPAAKWKSLQQARNMARQYRQKMGEQHNRSSVQQKLSQLESILSSKKERDQSILSVKKESYNSGQQNSSDNIESITSKKKFTDKKQILKILDDLDDQQQEAYAADFESYRDQSASKINY